MPCRASEAIGSRHRALAGKQRAPLALKERDAIL
jgi:hypothetical protein